MSIAADGEIEREARRVLRKLAAPGAHLRPHGADQYRLVSREDAGRHDGLVVASALVDAFARRGWLVRAGGARMYILSDAGAGWFDRALAEDSPFAAQHQIRRHRRVKDPRGVERRVTVDEGESPLARLRHRGMIDPAQFDAGEKLRRDFTLAQVMPRLGIDLTAPMISGSRGHKPDRVLADTVIAAKQRFARALHAVGPGLSDLLFDICCMLRGLEDAERAKGWPGRSGRVVLGIALDRLAVHYGLRVRGTAKMRGWQMEKEGDE
jgi:Domain of unknown function (DUF6456)